MFNTKSKPVSKSQIVQFFTNKNVLITGASGFLGKMLLEKLMRSCPEIGNVYLLLRERKGMQPDERLEKILNNPLFDVVKKKVPNFRKKIVPVRGDMKHDGLGLGSEETKMLINEINIVFHVAATVRFTEPLYEAININVKGTKEVIDLCQKIKNLDVAMVTSTAFSFAPLPKIEEAFLKPPITPKALLELMEGTSADTVNRISSKLLGKWPNTYTFTKSVMEDIVRENVSKLPVGLFRPPIVISTAKEPIEGWIDNLNGPIGMTIGHMSGFIHVCLCSRDVDFQVIPVDICINTLLACTYDTYEKSQIKNIDVFQPVYNCALRSEISKSTREVVDNFSKFHDECPFEKQVWAKAMLYTTSPVIYIIFAIFFHFIPGLFMDAACILQRKKPIFTKLYQRVLRENFAVKLFVTRDWEFSNENVKTVWDKMSDADKRIFSIDIQNIDMDEYSKNFMMGMKKYILREEVDEKSIEECRRKLRKLNLLHNILTAVFFIGCLYFVWRIFNITV